LGEDRAEERLVRQLEQEIQVPSRKPQAPSLLDGTGDQLTSISCSARLSRPQSNRTVRPHPSPAMLPGYSRWIHARSSGYARFLWDGVTVRAMTPCEFPMGNSRELRD
jgi:hypothetical protein